MASSKDYLDFILDQLSLVDGVSTRKMMGEYLVYVRGKLIGGIYDDCFLLKPLPAVIAMLPDAMHIAPYPAARKMVLVDKLDDKLFLRELAEAAYSEA